MSKEDAIRNHILNVAAEQFLKFGPSKVTTDELAGVLAMSKKTLYKYFPTKNDLLRNAMFNLMIQAENNVTKIIRNDQIPYVEKLRQLLLLLGNFISRLGAGPLQEFQKNTPELWTEIDQFRQEIIMKNFRGLLQEGIQTGYVCRDVNPEIVILIFLNSIRYIINPAVLIVSSFSMEEAFQTVVKVLFNGILTEGNRI